MKVIAIGVIIIVLRSWFAGYEDKENSLALTVSVSGAGQIIRSRITQMQKKCLFGYRYLELHNIDLLFKFNGGVSYVLVK